MPTWLTLYGVHGPFGPVPETIQGPVFIASEEIAGLWWGPDEMNPYQPFEGLEPANVVSGEILEYDGTFPADKVAAVSHSMLANMLLSQHKIDEAMLHAQKAVALNPNSLDAHEVLAGAYAANHQTDDAMREYHAAQHLYATVHPEFQVMGDPPQNPLQPTSP